jgi:high-affinity K+ transport system ATPase subunit B
MAFMIHRGLVIPVWAVAVCAVTLTTMPRLMPSVIALLGIAVVGRTVPAIARWLRPSRRLVEVLPAIDQQPARPTGIIMTGGTRARTFHEVVEGRVQKAADTADLVRMDDDGGPSELARANR